ncbi:interleukin-1 beta [Choloepus didactylus]|uniref:interleukin-1 beta n=1 Tax=Choloepus didactylus TaxID=27675 RepID=UPI00189CD2F7|nr:interleukin-1 beta [Choloepus didactylus]
MAWRSDLPFSGRTCGSKALLGYSQAQRSAPLGRSFTALWGARSGQGFTQCVTTGLKTARVNLADTKSFRGTVGAPHSLQPAFLAQISEAAMAAVPEPASEMMDYFSGNEDDLFFEVDGPKQTKPWFQDLDLCHLGAGGVRLQFSHEANSRSLRQVVSVVVALEKLKEVLVPCVPAFQDRDLTALLSCIFEEEPISTWGDAYVCDAPLRSLNCRLRDIEQKCLVLSGPSELRALHLNGDNVNRQVLFCMSFVQGEASGEKIPVALGIKEKNLYLSCVMRDGKPTLQLETVDPKNYPKKKMEKRFVFNKLEIRDKVEFESAEFPSWYISTSQEEEAPVFLGSTKGGRDIVDFTMEVVSP